MLAMFTMTPDPCRRMTGRAACAPYTDPIRLTSSVLRNSSISVSSKSDQTMTPAQFTQASIRPHRSTAARATFWTCSGTVTSHGTSRASPPRSSASRATASRSRARLAARTTRAPLLASASDMALPLPLVAPVTTTTQPSTRVRFRNDHPFRRLTSCYFAQPCLVEQDDPALPPGRDNALSPKTRHLFGDPRPGGHGHVGERLVYEVHPYCDSALRRLPEAVGQLQQRGRQSRPDAARDQALHSSFLALHPLRVGHPQRQGAP